MDPILRYAIISSCLLLIALIPFFVIRIYMFTVKSHFLLSKTAQRISLVTNLLSFILFLGLLIVYTFESGLLSANFYIIMVLTFALVLLIYKRLDMKPTEHTFIVSYTTLNSKKKLLQKISSNHHLHVATKSTFSFLTHVKYLSLNEEEVEEVKNSLKSIERVYISFKSITAYILFTLYVAFLSFAFVSFILFFSVLLT